MMEHDGDVSYYTFQLKLAERQLDTPVVISALRKDLLSEAEERVISAQKNLEDEIKRCLDANEWVENLLESLPKNK